MNKVKIKHNPYTCTTEILINGTKTENINISDLTSSSRLQMWVDKIIPKLMECLNSDTADIEFTGVPKDCYDFSDAVNNQRDKYRINLRCEEGGNPDTKLSDLKALLNRAKNGPVNELKTPEFLAAFESAINRDFVVSVQAPMKAGKSTFLNAMIGHDLLPENIDACTATITYIVDDDLRKNFVGHAVDFNNKYVGKTSGDHPVTSEILKKWNRDDIKEVRIFGNIPSIETKNIRLILVDTPGPNNSQNKNHGIAVQKFMSDKKNPLVLYLLDIGQFESTDSLSCLTYVANEMGKAGRQSSDRFLFVVTKVDDVDVEKRKIEDLVGKVRAYLQSRGIDSPKIIPVSAKFAKLTRMKRLKEHLTETEKIELDSNKKRFLSNPLMNYSQYANVTPYVRDKMSQLIIEAKKKGDNSSLMECYTGLSVVEATMQEFIEKYALPMKIHDAQKEIEKRLDQFNLMAQITEAIARNEEKRMNLHSQIEIAQENLRDGKEAVSFCNRIRNIKWEENENATLVDQYTGKVNAIYRNFRDDLMKLGPKLKPYDVINKTAIMHGEINHLGSELENSLKLAVNVRFEKLVKEYEQYVKKLLGNADVSLPQMKLVNLVMPSVDDLIQKATSPIDVPAGEKPKERPVVDFILGLFLPDPLIKELRSWIGDTETDYKKEDLVDTDKYLNTLPAKINEMFAKAKAEASTQGSKAINDMVQSFLNAMNRLDGIINNNLASLESASRSKEDAEKANRQLEDNKIWLDDFRTHLNKLVSI